MKTILLVLFLAVESASLYAQTSITGPLLDSAGRPANCKIAVTTRLQNGSASTRVLYQTGKTGNLAGVLGAGYADDSGAVVSSSAFGLIPGVYAAYAVCLNGYGTHLWTWYVPPGAPITISDLISGRRRKFGDVSTTFGSQLGTWGIQ